MLHVESPLLVVTRLLPRCARNFLLVRTVQVRQYFVFTMPMELRLPMMTSDRIILLLRNVSMAPIRARRYNSQFLLELLGRRLLSSKDAWERRLAPDAWPSLESARLVLQL